MLRRSLLCVIALGVSASAASAAYSDGIPPLQRVLAQTRSATPSSYANQKGTRVASARAFAEMRAYVIRRYAGVRVEHSFVDRGGSIVDCVPFADQPSVRGRSVERAPAPYAGAVPQTPARQTTKQQPRATALDVALHATNRDRFGNARFCKPSFVPLGRVTLEQLVRFATLQRFFSKSGEPDLDAKDDFTAGRREPPRPAGSRDPHYYARAVQFVDNLGTDSWLNVWSPTVAANQMSLSQIWVVGEGGGEGGQSPKQTVEAGWQVYPNKWNSSNAALFIYYTNNNYAPNSGCYNLDCTGFVQVANNVYLGGGFTHYSATGQTQWGFELQYKRDPRNGNWWLFYRGGGPWIAVGYYPQALFGTGRLATNATKVAWGGEDTGEPSALQMGSGAAANQGFGRAAFQNTIFYIDTSVVSQWATLSAQEIPGFPCYTTSLGSGGSWGVWLYFGGASCH